MTDETHKRQQEALAGPVLAVCTARDGAADSAQRAAKAQAALAKATAQAVKAAKNASRGFDELHLAAQDEEEAAKKSAAAKKSGGGSGDVYKRQGRTGYRHGRGKTRRTAPSAHGRAGRCTGPGAPRPAVPSTRNTG